MLISVAEYAELHGRDRSTAKRKIQAGKLKATRIGRSWAIDDAEPWPEDSRIKTGKYIGFREKLNK